MCETLTAFTPKSRAKIFTYDVCASFLLIHKLEFLMQSFYIILRAQNHPIDTYLSQQTQ